MNLRAFFQRLDKPRDVKRAVYRVHRLAGILLFAGAIYALDRLWSSYARVLGRFIDAWGYAGLHGMLVETLWLFLLIGNALALPASLVVVFRPSLLKGLERWADRFYGLRNSS
ncbi:MAG: hypothetical protein E6H54_12060 [Betaproteobacteria bacterium]|nr:MAG: hypothetical protein E6H54_12060 [Betaproteobacteria bacterium]